MAHSRSARHHKSRLQERNTSENVALQKGRVRRLPLLAVVGIPRPSEEVLARRSRTTLRRVGPDKPERGKLTPREREILGCLAEGLASAAIASRLAISRATVRNHTQRILAKLNVHTRLAAVSRGYATGLIAMPRRI